MGWSPDFDRVKTVRAQTTIDITHYQPRRLAAAVEQAEVILVARCISKQVRILEGAGAIGTHYNFEVLETVKGPPPGDRIGVVTIGGKLGGRTHITDVPQPDFQIGAEALLMLGRPNRTGIYLAIDDGVVHIWRGFLGRKFVVPWPTEIPLYSIRDGTRITSRTVPLVDLLHSLMRYLETP